MDGGLFRGLHSRYSETKPGRVNLVLLLAADGLLAGLEASATAIFKTKL
jgi:hypothetical protein